MSLMRFLDQPIEDYIHALSPDRSAVFKDMEALAEKQNFPIVGPLIGQFLKQLATISNAQRIFEMGSGFGYSALWFLEGMPGKKEIFLTDHSADNIKIADQLLKKAKQEKHVQTIVGDALTTLDKTPGEFDIIFIDIAKKEYPKAYFKAVPRLRRGGLLIADNVLWSGTVVIPGNDQDELGIKQFNQLTHTNPDLTTTLIPLRDGLSVSVKL